MAGISENLNLEGKGLEEGGGARGFPVMAGGLGRLPKTSSAGEGGCSRIFNSDRGFENRGRTP